MRQLLIPLAIFMSSILSAQGKSVDSSVNTKITALNAHISELEGRIQIERSINDKTFNSISTQISASSYLLTIAGIVFALAAIAIGAYVTIVQGKITAIGKENRKLLAKNRKIKQDVVDLNNLIQRDIYGLFKKIKREETVDLLTRLEKVPEDIYNIAALLLTRELLPVDFAKLRNAYLKLDDVDFKNYYKTLFFQHFLTEAIKDETLRAEILDFISICIENSFANDIIKSTHDFIVAVIDEGIHNFKREVNKFFVGLSSSKYGNYEPVYTTLFDTLKTRQNRFDFIDLVDSTEETRLAKGNFGKLLIAEYGTQQLTESENLTIRAIKQLESEEKNEEDAPPV